MTIKALKLARGKIEAAQMCHPSAVQYLLGEAWDLLNEALAQPEQEPVYQIKVYGSQTAWHDAGSSAYDLTSPNERRILYTTPPQRKPITDEQPRRWAVFCGNCRKEWTVPYQHSGKSLCDGCVAIFGIKGEA